MEKGQLSKRKMSEAAVAAPSKKSLKKEEKKAKKEAKDALPASAVKVFLSADQVVENTKLALAAAYLKIESAGVKDTKGECLCLCVVWR